MTAPAAGATVSATTTLTATATDNTGVAGVQFRLDGANLGAEDTTAPYSTSWNTTQATNGTHALTAVARDAAGNTNTSATISVTVQNTAPPDTTPPTVSVTAPAAGATVSATTTLTATATDNTGVAGVQFRLDGANLGAEDTTAPYSTSWNTTQATNGTHALTAVARDAAGNTNTSATITVTVQNTAPGTGPIAAWGFNEGAGTTVADATGRGHTGTITGATWTTTSKYGGALTFNGSSGMVTVPDADDLDISGAMTLEAWVRPTTLATKWRTVILKEAPGYFRYALYANTDTTGPSGHVFIGQDLEARRVARLTANTWAHLAAVYDGTRVRIFVDGVEAASAPATGLVQASDGVLRIGGNAIWNEWFAGQIDEVRIYGRALGAAEIQADMSTPVS